MGLTARDSFSYLLLVEEGLFFRRLLYHREHYPKADDIIGLIEVPFAALICHDALPFINRTFGVGLREDYDEITRIRHQTKSFDPKFFSFEEYSRDVDSILDGLNRQMKSHAGILAPIANALQPDIGIFYYQLVPICATYTVSYYVAPSGKPMTSEKAINVGFETGQAAAILFCLAERYYASQAFAVPPFIAQANDRNMATLIRKYRHKWGAADSSLFSYLLSV